MMLADQQLTTSRRGFTKTAAALAAAAIVPLPAMAAPPIDWKEIRLDVGCACAQVTFYDQEIAQARRTVRRWEARHPHEVTLDPERRTPRHRACLKASGLGALRADRAKACRRHEAIVARVAAIVPATLQDLRAKAELTQFDDADGTIRRSLLRDLGVTGDL